LIAAPKDCPGRHDCRSGCRSRRLGCTTCGCSCLDGRHAGLTSWFHRDHGLKSLERNILGMVGIGPIEETLIGMVDSPDAAGREKALAKLMAWGRAGA
jgi:hypothetical protein